MASDTFNTMVKPDPDHELPLEYLVDSYSFTSVFRTMAFVGDSLASGEFETIDSDGTHHYHDLYEYSWGQFIARKNGIKAYNFSRGGMTAKWYIETFADENDLWNKDKACQAYVIALGVNDLFNQNIPLGCIDDVKQDYHDNAKTYAGYYAQIICRYKEISPDAKFFFVTVPDDGRDPALVTGMRELLYSFAERFSNSYVLDLYKYGPPFDGDFIAKYYYNGHMNPMGYVLAAKMIDSYIDYIIRHNTTDFKEAGLINYTW